MSILYEIPFQIPDMLVGGDDKYVQLVPRPWCDIRVKTASYPTVLAILFVSLGFY